MGTVRVLLLSKVHSILRVRASGSLLNGETAVQSPCDRTPRTTRRPIGGRLSSRSTPSESSHLAPFQSHSLLGWDGIQDSRPAIATMD